VANDPAGGRLHGRGTAQRVWRERGFTAQPLGVVSRGQQKRCGVIRTDSRKGDQLRSHLGDQAIKVRIQLLGDLPRKCLLTPSHRTQSKLLGRSLYAVQIFAGSQAGGHTEELLRSVSSRKRWRSSSGAVTTKPWSSSWRPGLWLSEAE
jgi:hypothetical protein